MMQKKSPGIEKTIKEVILLCLVLIFIPGMMLLITGCGGAEGSDDPQQTITVTDSLGRDVEIPAGCDSIAALDSFAAEAMVMAGAGSRLVVAANGVQSNVILQEIYPPLNELAEVRSGGDINIEALQEAGTKLVIIKEANYRRSGEASKLDKLGIPYLVTRYSTMEEQIQALEFIGTVCGGEAQTRMDELTGYYRKVIDLVTEHTDRIPEKDRVRVYHSINEIARTDGRQSLGTDWITCAGAVDVSSGENVNVNGTDYQASVEQIYSWDPDVIICNEADTADYVLRDSKYQGLRAVREKAVRTIPVGASRWGRRGSVETFFAMLWLGSELYPEVYADVDLKKEVKEFYENVLGVEVDDALYEKILSGREIRRPADNVGGGNL